MKKGKEKGKVSEVDSCFIYSRFGEGRGAKKNKSRDVMGTFPPLNRNRNKEIR